MVEVFVMIRTMKILGLLSILFIIQVNCRSPYQTLCETCNCRTSENKKSSEISDCSLSINAKTSYDVTNSNFTNIRFNNVKIGIDDPNGSILFPYAGSVEFVSSYIVKLHPYAFSKNDLETLSFKNCTFTTAPTFNSSFLEELIIKKSSLDDLPNFEALPALNIVHLDGNNLKKLDEKAFENLKFLDEVRITNNELSVIHPRLFNRSVELSYLDLSHNLLSFFAFDREMKLEHLSLAYNQLEAFNTTSSMNMRNLNFLDLSHNKLTVVDEETISYMPSLEVLDLSYNQLTNLENNTFSHNTNLIRLILDGNNFKTLPIFKGSTDIFQTLNFFSCRNCGLVALSSFTFGSMPYLMNISLEGNDLQTLDPRAFAMVTSLRILDLSNNKITKLGNVFSDNKELEEINLSGNPLKTLNPKDFIGLENLRQLDASNAQLKSLWTDNFEYELKKLEQLTISNNSIEDITLGDLKVMPNLKFLDLENNPIRCTIHLANLIRWLTKRGVYGTDGANLLRTNDKLLDNPAQYLEPSYDHRGHWEELANSACRPSDDEIKNQNSDTVMGLIYQESKEIDDDVPKVYPPQQTTPEDSDESEDDLDDFDDDESRLLDIDDIRKLNALNVNDQFSLSQATYIISLTSVFVITALIVLMAAVSITLCILRKHNTLNIANANLPRIKIPRWETIPTQKKHSGSIYRPLSEEIISPPTPKINRYEFRTNPSVHSTQP